RRRLDRGPRRPGGTGPRPRPAGCGRRLRATPAGPEARRRPGVALPAAPGGLVIVRPLGAEDAGFGLHAPTRACAHDARAREALLKSTPPPPVASEHLTFTTDGLVRIALKRPFRDGTIAVDLDPCRSFVASPPPCPSPGNTRSSPRSGRC